MTCDIVVYFTRLVATPRAPYVSQSRSSDPLDLASEFIAGPGVPTGRRRRFTGTADPRVTGVTYASHRELSPNYYKPHAKISNMCS